MMETKHTPRLTADECPDANGFITLRSYDGTANGDTGEQPIATVYDQDHAEFIVQACNAHEDMVESAIEALDALDRDHAIRDGKIVGGTGVKAVRMLVAALAKAKAVQS